MPTFTKKEAFRRLQNDKQVKASRYTGPSRRATERAQKVAQFIVGLGSSPKARGGLKLKLRKGGY